MNTFFRSHFLFEAFQRRKAGEYSSCSPYRPLLTLVLFSLYFSVLLTSCRKTQVIVNRKVPEALSAAQKGRWILVDSKSENVYLKEGHRTLKTFANAAFGSKGVGDKRKRGDQITPRGRFRIGWVHRQSKFHIFYGLVYPRLKDAESAYSEGRINLREYSSIKRALSKGAIPPQNTRLGGHLGIHGVGKGNLSIHRNLNWTDGCIALDNDQISELSDWIRLGMMVEIR